MTDKPKRKVGLFDVLKEMSNRNLDVRLSTIDNISSMSYSRKKNVTAVTIGISGDVLNPLHTGKLHGGLLVFDWKMFEEVRKELEADAERGKQ